MSKTPISIQLLVSYALGELPEDEHARISQSLTERPELKAWLLLLDEIRAEVAHGGFESAPDDSVRRVKKLLDGPSRQSIVKRWLEELNAVVATLIFDSHSAQARLGYRGDDTARFLAYESTQAHVDLEITGQSMTPEASVQIRGQVKPTGDKTITSILLIDVDDQALVETTAPDERGYFRFRCSSGHYELAIEIDNGAGALMIREVVA